MNLSLQLKNAHKCRWVTSEHGEFVLTDLCASLLQRDEIKLEHHFYIKLQHEFVVFHYMYNGALHCIQK